MDKNTAFMVEEIHLQDTMDTINNRILFLKTNMPYPDVTPFSTCSYGYDGIDSLRFQKLSNFKFDEEIGCVTEFIYEPYFARMDFTVNSNNEPNQKSEIYYFA